MHAPEILATEIFTGEISTTEMSTAEMSAAEFPLLLVIVIKCKSLEIYQSNKRLFLRNIILSLDNSFLTLSK